MKSLILDTLSSDPKSNEVFIDISNNSTQEKLTSVLKLVDIGEPKLENNNYVKIKTKMCGICGTDLSVIKDNALGKINTRTLTQAKRRGPIFLGHEIFGEIVEIGKKVEKYNIGDRVIIADDELCSTFGMESCSFCEKGLPILCTNKYKRKYQNNVGAGWSEYLVRHQNQVFSIPNEMEDNLAVLMEPVAASLHAVLRSPPRENDRILIVGGGSIGLGVLVSILALDIAPIEITVLARHDFQRKAAMQFGSHHVVNETNTFETLSDILNTVILGTGENRMLNDGFDIIYDCVASNNTFNNGLRWLRPRGSLLVVGTNSILKNIDISLLWNRELNILGVHGYAYDLWEGTRKHTVDRCINWAANGRLNVRSLLTHKFPIHQYKDAIAVATSHHSRNVTLAEAEKCTKVVFNF